MAGGSLESTLRCTHEILNTHEIRDGVGEKGKKGVRDLSSLSPLLHLLKILAVSTRSWGYRVCLSPSLVGLVSCVQCSFH